MTLFEPDVLRLGKQFGEVVAIEYSHGLREAGAQGGSNDRNGCRSRRGGWRRLGTHRHVVVGLRRSCRLTQTAGPRGPAARLRAVLRDVATHSPLAPNAQVERGVLPRMESS